MRNAAIRPLDLTSKFGLLIDGAKKRNWCNMTVNKHADGIGPALLDRNDGLQEYRGIPRSIRAAFYVPEIRTGRGSKASGAGRQIRQGAMRAQERAPDYRVVAAWSGFLAFIGAGAFVLGMAIHNAVQRSSAGILTNSEIGRCSRRKGPASVRHTPCEWLSRTTSRCYRRRPP